MRTRKVLHLAVFQEIGMLIEKRGRGLGNGNIVGGKGIEVVSHKRKAN